MFNPTREDKFLTVNIEALVCGTPVITYNTGESTEAVNDKCGVVIKQGDVERIKEIIEIESFEKSMCIK